MSEIVNFESINRAIKRRERAEDIKSFFGAVGKGLNENKEILILGIPLLTATTRMVTTAISKSKVRMEIRDKETKIYDRSLGRYETLKKPLTPTQALNIEERRKNGEKLNAILNDMGLLKR